MLFHRTRHLDHQSIAEIIGGVEATSLRSAHSEERFDDVSYCANCDQLYDLPESLVWTSIPGREYGQSKITKGLDHRSFTPAGEANGDILSIE